MAATFGQRLRALREKASMSQHELARRLHISQSSIAYYELDKKHPGPETLKRIAAFFGVTTDYLLCLSPDPTGCHRAVTTIAAHREDDPLADLPEEARKSVRDFIDYAKRKYGKKEGR